MPPCWSGSPARHGHKHSRPRYQMKVHGTTLPRIWTQMTMISLFFKGPYWVSLKTKINPKLCSYSQRENEFIFIRRSPDLFNLRHNRQKKRLWLSCPTPGKLKIRNSTQNIDYTKPPCRWMVKTTSKSWGLQNWEKQKSTTVFEASSRLMFYQTTHNSLVYVWKQSTIQFYNRCGCFFPK